MIQLADCLKRKGKKFPQKHQNVPQSIGKNKKGKIIQLTSKVKVSWECYTMWKKIAHLDLKFTKEICISCTYILLCQIPMFLTLEF